MPGKKRLYIQKASDRRYEGFDPTNSEYEERAGSRRWRTSQAYGTRLYRGFTALFYSERVVLHRRRKSRLPGRTRLSCEISCSHLALGGEYCFFCERYIGHISGNPVGPWEAAHSGRWGRPLVKSGGWPKGVSADRFGKMIRAKILP